MPLFLAAACGLSVLMSILFWSQISQNTTSSILMGSMGMLFDATKLCALPATFWFLRDKRWFLSLFSMKVYLILAIVSIIASIGVLKKEATNSSQVVLSASKEHQSLLKQVHYQQEIIESLIASQKKDIELGYRARAQQTNQQLQHEKEKLYALAKQVESGKSHPVGMMGELSKSLASVISVDPSRVENWLSVGLGVLLELATTFLLVTTH